MSPSAEISFVGIPSSWCAPIRSTGTASFALGPELGYDKASLIVEGEVRPHGSLGSFRILISADNASGDSDPIPQRIDGRHADA